MGLQAMAAAGYDPEAMVRMFGAMQRMARLQGGTPPEFLLTHPVSDSRLSDAQARAAQLSVANRYTSDTLYDMMRARALLSIHRNSPQQAAARLEQESAEEPALRYVSALIDAQNGQTDQALQTLDRLASELPDYAMLPASAAQVALQAQRYDDAIQRSQRLLRLMPNYLPAQLTLAEAQLQRDPQAAYTLLREVTARHPDNPQGFNLLAEAAGRSGHNGWGHRPGPNICSSPAEWIAAFASWASPETLPSRRTTSRHWRASSSAAKRSSSTGKRWKNFSHAAQPDTPRPGAKGRRALFVHTRQNLGVEVQHPLQRLERLLTQGRIDENFAAAFAQRARQVIQRVHRHPRAVGTATAGGSIACGRRFEQRLARHGLLHLEEDAAVGGHDQLVVGQRLRRLDQLRGRTSHIGELDDRFRRLRVHQHGCLGVQAFQVLDPPALNSSWTMQAPSHISMSAPVFLWM